MLVKLSGAEATSRSRLFDRRRQLLALYDRRQQKAVEVESIVDLTWEKKLMFLQSTLV